MLKLLTTLLKSVSIGVLLIFLLIVLYITFNNVRCKLFLQGISNSELVRKNGISYLKESNQPYSGKAYDTVCGGECGFLSCALLHWRGEYKDGKLHGKLDVPKSGLGDKHWFSPDEETQTYIYDNGKRVK